MFAHVKTSLAFCLLLSVPAGASDLIVGNQGCFSGEFAEYDSWMAGLEKRKPDFDPHSKGVLPSAGRTNSR